MSNTKGFNIDDPRTVDSFLAAMRTSENFSSPHPSPSREFEADPVEESINPEISDDDSDVSPNITVTHEWLASCSDPEAGPKTF